MAGARAAPRTAPSLTVLVLPVLFKIFFLKCYIDLNEQVKKKIIFTRTGKAVISVFCVKFLDKLQKMEPPKHSALQLLV